MDTEYWKQKLNRLWDEKHKAETEFFAARGADRTHKLGVYLKAQRKYEELRIQLAQNSPIHREYDGELPIVLTAEMVGDEDDMVDHPPHYQAEIECIDAIKAACGEHFVYHCTSTAMKYLWRWDSKAAPEQDLKKARWYINKAIKEVEDA